MARHRNVRNLDFQEERDYDEVFGRSLEDDVAISPATAAQFMYPRGQDNTSLSSYMRPHPQRHPIVPEIVTEERPPKHKDSSGRGSSVYEGGVSKITQAPVKVKSSTAQPKMGFITDKTFKDSRSPSPAPPISSKGTPNTTPSRQPPQLSRSMSKNKHMVDVLAEYSKRCESSKPQVNMVVVGHVDAGKSTLMGHLLFLVGQVSKRTLNKYEHDSQKIGKASFMYAWVLDETGEERTRGITMDIAQQQFDTDRLSVNLLDAPGHRDFIPNMITGAAQADVAVLVVDATTGEFESGFESGGQTREHAVLVRSLGVTQLIVAINKMDTVEWAESRFIQVVDKLKVFLKTAGYKDHDIKYVPCSGLTGDNLIKRFPNPHPCDWYTGPTLLECIDTFNPPKRPVDKPFRCCLADIFKTQGTGGINIAGKIESGHVQVGETVLLQPANEHASIRGITVNELSSLFAVAGDQVSITLTGIDPANLVLGSVLCSPDHPILIASVIRSRIIVFNIDVPITLGYPVLFHHQSVCIPAVIKQLLSQLNKSSGEVIKKKPRCLTKNCSAIVDIELSKPVCVELYHDSKELGRFMLRYGGKTIAAGVVTKVL